MNEPMSAMWLTETNNRPLVGVAGPAGSARPPAHPEHSVVVCGTAGGVGTTVVSGLLADYRAATGLGGLSWWVDLSGHDSDMTDRMRAQPVDEQMARSPLDTGLWTPPAGTSVATALEQVWQHETPAVPVIDAGAQVRSVIGQLCDTQFGVVTPVLVIGPRPDLLNRARPVLAEWDSVGLLERTVLVICCQIPTLNHAALTGLLRSTVDGQVAAVVGLDYDPILGSGTDLDREAQERFSPQTWDALHALAEATSDTVGRTGRAVSR